MIEKNQAERLAAMANALRPDWPIKSLMTMLTHHRDRPYRDLAVALAWIAADAHTTTPGRLAEAGPWWDAAVAHLPVNARPTPIPPKKCPRCGCFARTPEGNCLDCHLADKARGAPAPPPARLSRDEVRRAIAQARAEAEPEPPRAEDLTWH